MIEVTHPLFMKLFDEAIKANGTNYLVGDSVSISAPHSEYKHTILCRHCWSVNKRKHLTYTSGVFLYSFE